MISICIPAYKHILLTHEAVKSVLQQDADVELIVLDDFYMAEQNKENNIALDELQECLHGDERVISVSNTTHLPIQANWNKAISLSSGSFVKLLGADDKMLPGSINRMAEIICKSPDVKFHGHLANIINDVGDLVRSQRPFCRKFIGKKLSRVEALKGKVRQQVRFKEPSCNFFQKKAWEEIGGYNNTFRFTFDVHFNCRMMSNFPSMLWNDYLVELRRHKYSDGAQLPAFTAINDLKGLVFEIFEMLGSDLTSPDRAAAYGWLQYRVLELIAQRIRRQPVDMMKFINSNFEIFFQNPLALIWLLKYLRNRIVYDDVQQH